MKDTILVPLDGSPFAEQVLPLAASMARTLDIPLELVRVHLAPTLGFSQDVFHATLDEDADARMNDRAYLDRLALALANQELDVHTTLLDARSVPDAIVARATAARARIIVMTTHGRTGVRRTIMGSVADEVVRQSTIPVLLWTTTESHPVRSPSLPFTRVLVPLDGSLAGEAILPHAVMMAQLGSGRLTLLRVVGPALAGTEPPATVPISPFFAYASAVTVIDEQATQHATEHASAYLNATATQLRTTYHGLRVDVKVMVDERVDVAVLAAAKQEGADLVALVPQGLGASRVIVGSTADSLLRERIGAVMLLRPSAAQEA